ncbi:MAG TPA: DUF4136 domain-containing protein [Chryseolinea sp.]|nr:DUF4136 domain-containing protein [Chryseolinea sp.]
MKRGVILLSFCLLVISVAGQSMKITMEKGVDMTSYETFTVMKGEVMTPPDARKINENTMFQSVKAAVTKEMELRGYKFVADSSAQLYISYVAGAYNLTEGGNTGPLGQTPASTPADMDQSRSWSRESREGMMVIDIMDARSKKELWKAEGSLSLENVDTDRALDALVYKAFKKFPNKNKKKKK